MTPHESLPIGEQIVRRQDGQLPRWSVADDLTALEPQESRGLIHARKFGGD
jgi:hypothetical protein